MPEALTKVQLDREADQAPLSLRLIVRLFKYTRPHAWVRNWLLVSVAMRSVQLPMVAWLLSAVLHGPVADRNWSGVVWGAVGFAALALFTTITFVFRMRLALELGERVVHDLRRDIFDHLQRLTMRWYNKTRVGRIISRMTSDAEAVRTGVQDVLFISLVQVGQMIGAAAVMVYYDPLLFLVVLAMAPLLYEINRYFRSRFSKAYREMQESFSRITATLAESVSGIRVTQGFVRQETNAELFHDLIENHSEYNIRAARLTGVFLPMLELNTQLFLSILLVLGGYEVLYGEYVGVALANFPDWMTAGTTQEARFDAVFTFFFMAPLFLSGFSTLGRMYNQALTAMAGAERVFNLLDTKVEKIDDEDASQLPPIEGWVQFKGVTFGYDPKKPVLHDLTFTADPGQTIALVGHTGSGKSSIINLITKFYVPQSGRVLIDGYDTRAITSESLLEQIGIVLQQNFLFTGSVMDNIRMGKPTATREEVVDAAEKLGVLDLLEAMPDGLDTQVGERGGSLSLGQRQIVCFTRAMLADPRILILDEATSSVDTMTEARIQEALGVLLKDRTSFVVAHRLSTIRHADEVLVLDHGRIKERGTHTQLLAHGGVYANLYRQFIRAAEG